MNNWFTSDQHYGHKNIIKYANRPFEDVEEMNETMIANHNSRVMKGDSVFMIGDFAFLPMDKMANILRRLNGQKFLIYGNHDKTIKGKELEKFFAWRRDYKRIKINDQTIVLSHYAMRVWDKSHHGAWQLYGHSHGSLPDDPTALAIDVGVDCHNYFPISFEEVKAIMDAKMKNITANNLVMTKDHHTVKINNEKSRL